MNYIPFFQFLRRCLQMDAEQYIVQQQERKPRLIMDGLPHRKPEHTGADDKERENGGPENGAD